MSAWRVRDPAIPLGLREAARVIVGLIAVALLCSWPQLLAPGRITEFEPGAFRRLALLSDPSLTSQLPLFGREILWTIPGRALMDKGGLTLEHAVLVLTIAGSLLSGLAVWLLLRWLTRAPLASFCAAAVVLVLPWRTTAIGDPALAWMFGPALTFLGIGWIARGGGWLAGLVAGGGFALAGYTSYAQLPPTLLGALVLLLAHIPLMRRPFPDGAPPTLRDLGVGLATACAAAAVVLWPAWREGLPAAPPGAGTSSLGWLAEDGRIQLLGVEGSAGGHVFYWPVMLGWLTCLVLVWIVFHVRDPRLRPWWMLTLAAFLLVQGTRLHIAGNEIPSVIMPYAWCASLPGFGALPGPSIWLPILGIALGGVLALGLKEWQVQHGTSVTFAVALLTAVELRPAPLPEPTMQTPTVYARMAREVEGSVLELPLDSGNAIALWHAATTHHRPVAFAATLAGDTDVPLGVPAGLMSALAVEPRGAYTGKNLPTQILPRLIEEKGEATLEAWKEWLVENAHVRWIVFRRAPDFGISAKLRDQESWATRFKEGLKPWYFNTAFTQERQNDARALASAFADRADRSARAHALITHWFGKPQSRLGSAYTEVWEIRPEDLVPGPGATKISPATADRNEGVAVPAGG